MIESIKNIFAIPDLRRRVLYTLALLAVYRLGGHIATPGVSWRYLEQWFEETQGGGLLGFVDLFAGGNLRRFTIFALGIMPYVSASIILQLLTIVFPTLERLSKEGEVGRRKITQWTRYGTILLSIVQSLAIASWLQSVRIGAGGAEVGVVSPSVAGLPFILLTMLTLTTGTAFIMWLGEQISDRGIGNGISLIIFAGIVVGFPGAVIETVSQVLDATMNPVMLLALIGLMIAVVTGIVYVERAQRKIPIQYARRVVGRKIYGGQATYLPLRVNSGGVIPVIFASSILAIPQTLLNALTSRYPSPAMQMVAQQLGYSMPIYNLLYFAMIIAFCFFYTSIIFNPVDTADNMKKYGGFIPGIRPGRRTAEYIDRILTRLTFGGAVYLGLISILPVFLISGLHLHQLPVVGEFFSFLPDFMNVGFGITFYFGGTSLLIVVGVAMDTVQQIESQLIMRNYDGFLKGARIRGRRG
jgi:preprotein translocase subunit SecY